MPASEVYFIRGDWKKATDCAIQRLRYSQALPTHLSLKPRSLGSGGAGPWNLLWSGRFAEAEQDVREAVTLARQSDNLHALPGLLRTWGLALGYQTKYAEAEKCFVESDKIYRQGSGKLFAGIGINLGLSGTILRKQGELDKAEQNLTEALSIKLKGGDNIGIPELLVWLGELYEVKAKQKDEIKEKVLLVAESYYRQCLDDYRWVGRLYFECGSLTGLVRVKHAQGDYAAIPPLLAEAEQLAQQYEYNDHLASLRLTQGHLALESKTFEVSKDLEGLSNFDAAQHYYQHALTYALRYNRFLLDEVLSGRPQGTPLRPIIPHCLERDEEGRRMLVALRDWWKTDVNDIGTPRPDTISPIPEGIPLIEAERIAREREPGDGSPQALVVEQIEQALAQTAG
jgi:tetratricopeptide (TPR) repeat protein